MKLRKLCIGLLALLLTGSYMTPDADTEKNNQSRSVLHPQPNIILIIGDDQGFQDFGFQEVVTGIASEIPTPNLDALCREGVLFSNFYTASICSPSRASLVTGSYSQRVGYENNVHTHRDPYGIFEGLPPETITIWERMVSLGYTTGSIGKWHLGSIGDIIEDDILVKPGNRPPRQGIDEFYGMYHGARQYYMGAHDDEDYRVYRELSLDRSQYPDGRLVDRILEHEHEGEYVTSTWCQAAIDFIDRHYKDPDPFFLYLAFNAPHVPLQESPDFNDPRLSHLSGDRKVYASMVYTMDKEIGRLVEKLNDPDGNGEMSDAIKNNTYIIFMNDNGGPSSNASVNDPLRAGKATHYEGGIRVPMFITGPGITEEARGSVFDRPIHSMDILPTCYSIGGGGRIHGIDGVDLLPFINGTTPSAPHESIIVRRVWDVGLRMGEWKLVKQGRDSDFELFNLAEDLSESKDVSHDNPVILSLLKRELTSFEARMDKMRFPGQNKPAGSINLHNQFRFHSTGSATDWSEPGAWMDPATGKPDTLLETDAFAGCVLEFQTSDDNSCVATNDMTRPTSLEFILNKVLLTGSFKGQSAKSTTIDGNSLLLTNDLEGNAPGIQLAANGPEFTFHIDMPLLLFDDMEITGNGSASFIIRSDISDYFDPRGVIKKGEATVNLSGTCQYKGNTTLLGGTTFISGSLAGSKVVTVKPGARLGGTGSIAGDLLVAGDVVPGPERGTLAIRGDASVSGNINIELDAGSHNTLSVGGTLELSGATLDVTFLPVNRAASEYVIASYGKLNGRFATVNGMPEGYSLDYAFDDGVTANNIAIRREP